MILLVKLCIFLLPAATEVDFGWLSRLLTAHQHHLGYLVPLLGKIKQMQ